MNGVDRWLEPKNRDSSAAITISGTVKLVATVAGVDDVSLVEISVQTLSIGSRNNLKASRW